MPLIPVASSISTDCNDAVLSTCSAVFLLYMTCKNHNALWMMIGRWLMAIFAPSSFQNLQVALPHVQNGDTKLPLTHGSNVVIASTHSYIHSCDVCESS